MKKTIILRNDVEIPLFVVMPNHIHSIVYIDRDIWGMTGGDAMNNGVIGDAMNNGVIGDAMNRVSTGGGITGRYNPRVTNCLGTVIRRLKARVTRLSNQNSIPFGWQARFYDRIVRNQNEPNNTAEYSENNVVNWQLDEMIMY